MARRLTEIICVIGCWVSMIYAAHAWGLKALAVVVIALLLAAIATACVTDEAEEEECEDNDQAQEENHEFD